MEKLCPFAKHELVHYNGSLPMREHSNTLIVHTNGGGTGPHGDLKGWFDRPGNDICAHFQLAKDGTLYQYVEVDREAYAQFSGNHYGVSVECEDDGHPETPLTDEQLKMLVRLAKWLKCPARVAADSASPGGVGWHSLYHDWNQSAHNCPGSVRIHQIHSYILPHLAKTHPGPGPRPHPHPTHAPAWYKRELMHSTPLMHGADVKHVQELVGLKGADVDGKYGPQTERHVVAWQEKHGLQPDGIFGPACAAKAAE